MKGVQRLCEINYKRGEERLTLIAGFTISEFSFFLLRAMCISVGRENNFKYFRENTSLTWNLAKICDVKKNLFI